MIPCTVEGRYTDESRFIVHIYKEVCQDPDSLQIYRLSGFEASHIYLVLKEESNIPDQAFELVTTVALLPHVQDPVPAVANGQVLGVYQHLSKESFQHLNATDIASTVYVIEVI